jgi:hypothetical protein
VLEGAVWDFWFGVLFFLAHDEHDGLYVWYGDVIFMKGVVWRAIEGIVSEEIGKLKHCSFLVFLFCFNSNADRGLKGLCRTKKTQILSSWTKPPFEAPQFHLPPNPIALFLRLDFGP